MHKSRFFATVPVIRSIYERVPTPKKHHNIHTVNIETLAKCIEPHFDPFYAEDNRIMRYLYTNAEVVDKFIHNIVNVNGVGKNKCGKIYRRSPNEELKDIFMGNNQP